ncbi:PrsW family glutamic-type intramembrane protease [Thermocoleostomius sinensis]|uniref:PrsW family glutamic-type intramembrane protease n=1 Tax=Thermocoleostomius sinensis A174 TaxID=2016057 RepID=A0A9E8ZFF5_9CYAN|nr:PrsW family glutamic-type intramembrane protease [Thermocoleostomius sinensis]WAL60822.1 PrsW family glutamic-type intramembrane protease [Thermocoleostomius sinensis A174]
MTGSSPRFAVLRLVPPPGGAALSLEFYPLMPSTAVLIGRDPRCQIILDSQFYTGVSRQHAQVAPSSTSPSGWQVCDLNSANGTYVNDRRIYGCHALQWGDCITLAQEGPRFIFEVQSIDAVALSPDGDTVPEQANLPSPAVLSGIQPPHPNPGTVAQSDAVTFSQLFPIISTGRDLKRKAYLVPGMITVVFVVLMFVTNGSPQWFNPLLAAYIAGGAYYFVYQLCGKRKPWWVLISSALMTAFLLLSPVLLMFIFVFRGILPGTIPDDPATVGLGVFFINMFFGAGLMEELLKAVPVLLAYYIGRKVRSSPLREQIGVWEPLDGILLGTASAVGFTLLETLGQYVPSVISDVTLQAGPEAGQLGQLLGLQLLIPRILGSISGHMAYSGYFGYFIGLSVLKPSKRWQILGIGYLTAAILHTLWNTTGAINILVLAAVGMISYAFLAAAILKARALSPTRRENFATRLDVR